MSKHIIFEVVKSIDHTKASAVLYREKEDAWRSVGDMLNRFIEDHDGRIDINGIEIDAQSVCMEYVYKKSPELHYMYYDIKGRFVY